MALKNKEGRTIFCSENVFGGLVGGGRCSKGATVVRDQEPYCGTHDPVRVKERRAAREKKWVDKEARKDEHRKQCKADFTKRIMETTTEMPAAALVDEILSAGFAWWG